MFKEPTLNTTEQKSAEELEAIKKAKELFPNHPRGQELMTKDLLDQPPLTPDEVEELERITEETKPDRIRRKIEKIKQIAGSNLSGYAEDEIKDLESELEKLEK